MYVLAGVRTPFSFHNTKLALLKSHNLGTTVVRALLSMLPNMNTRSIQQVYIAASRHIGAGSVRQVAKRAGLCVTPHTVFAQRSAGLKALQKVVDNPPSEASFVVGIEGGYSSALAMLSKCHPVEATDYHHALLEKTKEELITYLGVEVPQGCWDTFLCQTRSRAKEADRTEMLLHEIAPIALAVVDAKVQHIIADDALRVKKMPTKAKEGRLSLQYLAPLCDGALALCLSMHKSERTLARIADVIHVENCAGGLWVALKECAQRLLQKKGLQAKNVQIVECDDSVLIAPYSGLQAIGFAPEVINRWGGACSLGYAGAASELRMVLAAANGMMLLEEAWGLVLCPDADGGAVGVLLERCDEVY